MKLRNEPALAALRKLSDEELIHRYVHRREQGPFHCLYDRYSHLVLGVCINYLGDVDAAKDATQQIFIKLLTDLHRFQIEHFRPWLLQVARNHCLMQLRKDGREIKTDMERVIDMELTDDWHQQEDQEELLQFMESALAELNDDQRICIQLFYLKKKTYAEIAGATHFNIQQVKSHIQNGRRNLKIKIQAARAAKPL